MLPLKELLKIHLLIRRAVIPSFTYSDKKRYIWFFIKTNYRSGKHIARGEQKTKSLLMESKMIIDSMIDNEIQEALEHSKDSVNQLRLCMNGMSVCTKEVTGINAECDKIMSALEKIDNFIETGEWQDDSVNGK